MQVEFLHSRLMQLKERIDDTEDLINIELDQRRNELVGHPTSSVQASVLLQIVSGDCGCVPLLAWFHPFEHDQIISHSKTSDEPPISRRSRAKNNHLRLLESADEVSPRP